MAEKKVAVFCSASYNIDPKYSDLARDIVRGLCACGYTLVSGGTVKGTMGAVADEAVRCGGKHIGVLPRFMEEVRHPGLAETVWTETMSGRKERMREGTCAAIALPGGVGTLDELMETLTLAKLGKYSGRVFAVNYEGFYAPLIALLDHYAATGMLDGRSRQLIAFPEDAAELLRYFH